MSTALNDTPPADTTPADGTPPAAAADGTPPAAAADGTPPAAETVLADYEFAFPDGFDQAQLKVDDVKAFAKELGLDPVADKEKAQKILDRVIKQRDDFMTAQENTKNEVIEGWVKEAREDTEIGGDKFDVSLASARTVIDNPNIVTPEFKTFLNETGLGNHPEMIRVFARLAPHFANDSPVPGGGGTPKGDPVAGIYDHPSSQPSQ